MKLFLTNVKYPIIIGFLNLWAVFPLLSYISHMDNSWWNVPLQLTILFGSVLTTGVSFLLFMIATQDKVTISEYISVKWNQDY